MKITEYPHLELTQAEFDSIVAVDPVILGYLDGIEEQKAKFDQYSAYDAELRKEIEAVYDREAVLKGELKVLHQQKREIRGRVAQNVMRDRRSKRRVSQLEKRITAREKQLFQIEMQRRLRTLGRTHKLARGKRTIEETVPFDPKTQFK